MVQFVQQHDILTVKVYLYPGIRWENSKYSQFRSISFLFIIQYTFNQNSHFQIQAGQAHYTNCMDKMVCFYECTTHTNKNQTN